MKTISIVLLLVAATSIGASGIENLDLSQVLKNYFSLYDAYEITRSNQDHLNALESEAEIVDAVFQDVDSPRYEADLKQIDQLSHAKPGAISDLAYSLQNRWENQFLIQTVINESEKNETDRFSSQIAYDLGMLLVGGGTAVTRVLAARSYFKIARAAISVTGASTAVVIQGLGMIPEVTGRSKIPLSPAELMTLGMQPTDEYITQADRRALVRHLQSEAASVTAGTLSFTFLSARVLDAAAKGKYLFNLLTSPARATVAGFVTLGLSTAAMVGTEKVVDHLGNEAEEQTLRSKLYTEVMRFNLAQAQGDESGMLEEAPHLINASKRLESFYDLDVLKIYLDRKEKDALLEKQVLSGNLSSDQYWADLNHAQPSYIHDIQGALKKNGDLLDPLVMNHFSREILRESAFCPYEDQLSSQMRQKLVFLSSSVEQEIGRFTESHRENAKLSRLEKIKIFQEVLDQEDRKEEASLSQDISLDRISDRPDRLLLQVIALLKAPRKRSLELYVDNLLDLEMTKRALLTLSLNLSANTEIQPEKQ